VAEREGGGGPVATAWTVAGNAVSTFPAASSGSARLPGGSGLRDPGIGPGKCSRKTGIPS